MADLRQDMTMTEVIIHNKIQGMRGCGPSIFVENCNFLLKLSKDRIFHQALKIHLQNLVDIFTTRVWLTKQNILVLYRESEISFPVTLEENSYDEDLFRATWNIRKYCFTLFKTFADIFRSEFFSVLFPVIERNLLQTASINIEVGIFLLGTIIDSCIADLDLCLDKLVPYLLEHLSGDIPIIQQSTCSTLSQISSYILDWDDNDFMDPYVSALLQLVLSPRQKLQFSACTALIQLETEYNLTDYVKIIMETLQMAFNRFPLQNSSILNEMYNIFSNINARLFL